MLTNVIGSRMPVEAKRVFRLALITSLSLVVAYGMAFPLPFFAPIFALMLTATPGPPMHFKSVFGLFLVVLITLGIGLLLIPILVNYPVSAVLIIAVGLFLSTYISVNAGKGLVGSFLTIGFTIIPAAGLAEFYLGVVVIKALILGLGLAILCQWLVYPLFPEDPETITPPPQAYSNSNSSNWIALRVTLIVLPPFLMALANPSMYLKVILKSVSLGQQSSEVSAVNAGRELLGSTFLGGFYAAIFWIVLKIHPSLWMFFLWTLLFIIYFSSKFYQVITTRFPPSFWLNVAITMLILLGSAVQDSANGNDVYQAFVIRMNMFVAVTLYAWLAIYMLEKFRTRYLNQPSLSQTDMESRQC